MKILICIIVLFICSNIAKSQWVSSLGNNEVTALDFRNGVGLALMAPNLLLKTTDNGQSWDTLYIESPVGHIWLAGLDIVNDTLIFGAGPSGAIYKSTNAGVNWSGGLCNICTSADDFLRIKAITQNLILAYGDHFIYLSWNSGQTWERININDQIGAYNLLNFSGHFGWIVSGYYHISKTTNRGLNWITTPINSPAYGLTQIGDTIWSSTHNGSVYKSTDEGESWNLIYRDSTLIMWGIKFLTPLTGYTASGNWSNQQIEGKIFKTTDGGFSWNEELSSSTMDYFDIVATSNKLFITGSEGIIYKDISVGITQISTEVPSHSNFHRTIQIRLIRLQI